MLSLNNVTKIKKDRKRIGRGGDSGGTSGRGHKGQNARSGGKVKASFEGGQMAITRRLPKRGFKNTRFATEICIVNLTDLERHFDEGATVDQASLGAKRLVKKASRVQVKLLGKGTLTKKLIVSVHQYSASAKTAITKAGGEIKAVVEGETNSGNAK